MCFLTVFALKIYHEGGDLIPLDDFYQVKNEISSWGRKSVSHDIFLSSGYPKKYQICSSAFSPYFLYYQNDVSKLKIYI